MINNDKIKVILIGPISYVGGVSIHMNRLENILSSFFVFLY